MKPLPSPVETLCLERRIPFRHSRRISADGELLAALEERPPHSILVVDFGQRIPEPILSAPLWGCLNIHPSLLPRYRGAAPVQRALMNGEERTGVTLFRLVEEMDAGPVLLQEELPLEGHETAGDLFDILALKGSNLYRRGVQYLIEGSYAFTDQDSKFATYAHKISNIETEFTWNTPARSIVNLVRALNPTPGAYVRMEGRRLKVWQGNVSPLKGSPGEVLGFDGGYPVIGTSEGSVVLRCIQPEGKRRLDAAEWARGMRLKTKGVLP